MLLAATAAGLVLADASQAQEGGGLRGALAADVSGQLADEDDHLRTLTIVGDDEADASAGRIGWSAPLARALIGAKAGDERTVQLPSGERSYKVLSIRYPD